MPLPLDEMTEPDRLVTRRELRDELIWLVSTLETKLASKQDLKRFATKKDLKTFATREDLKAFATKADLKAGLHELRSHFDAVAESFKGRFPEPR